MPSVGAEVTVGGDGRMGVISTAGGDIAFTSRVRISFTATGETDNGLTFGGSIRADNAGGTGEGAAGGVKGKGGSVNIAGPFGKIAMGDVDGAAKAAVGHAGGVGLTGLGDLNEIKYLSGGGDPSALWSYTMGELTLHASSEDPGPEGDQTLSGALGYNIGGVGVAVGVERKGDEDHVAAGVSAGLGDASVKLVFGSQDDEDQYGASASFVTGSATFTAFTSSNLTGQDHFGIGAAFDLGGGAAIKGGFVDGDSLADPSFDLGVSMSF